MIPFPILELCLGGRNKWGEAWGGINPLAVGHAPWTSRKENEAYAKVVVGWCINTSDYIHTHAHTHNLASVLSNTNISLTLFYGWPLTRWPL